MAECTAQNDQRKHSCREPLWESYHTPKHSADLFTPAEQPRIVLLGQVPASAGKVEPYLRLGRLSVCVDKPTYKHTRISTLPPCLCNIRRHASRRTPNLIGQRVTLLAGNFLETSKISIASICANRNTFK